VEWKKVKDYIEREAKKGFDGRFGAGLPRIDHGSLLFIQHMISKMKPLAEGGSRIAIVFNGSPLFTGAAGSGESKIHRWIIENDWLESVVALPDNLFYNTDISTYLWIVTNRKSHERRTKVQLVDARELWVKMRKSLGKKRKEISSTQIEEITPLYADFTKGENVKIFPNAAFGFQRIAVERPLRLRWEVTEGTISEATSSKAWAKLSAEDQDQMLGRLTELIGSISTDASALRRKLAPVPKAVDKPLMDALAVRDPNAPVVTKSKGRSEPDPELRDNENVPLLSARVRWARGPLRPPGHRRVPHRCGGLHG